MTSKKWCTEKLIENGGFLSVRIPKDLLGGEYLIRTELLSLHEADKNPAQPQWYIGCAQIFLESTATSVPVDTVKIPGYVDSSHPSLHFNIYYKPKFPYIVSGPKPYQSALSKAMQVKQDYDKLPKAGRLPPGVILTNANWWTKEVPAYSDEAGCWRVRLSSSSALLSLYQTF
jgi:hypothetical protein